MSVAREKCPACHGDALIAGLGGVLAYWCCRGGVRDPGADRAIEAHERRVAEAATAVDKRE